MGSGENSPAMVTPHQNVLKSLPKDSLRVNLDTPYGFQENADELTEKIRKYFAVNVGYEIEDLQARHSSSDNAALDHLSKAMWAFSGPGSPTYALKTWRELGINKALEGIVDRGAVVLASAAAMSIGARVMPVYEMYKVGTDPHWLEGTNLLNYATGLNAVVIAHYNNTQGGTHDTRYCFIGQKRMDILERQLDGEAILGIDEHTGIQFELESKTFEVLGKGKITFKKDGETREYSKGDSGEITSL